MKRTQAPIYLKSILDSLEVKPLKDYLNLDPYLLIQRFRKGQISTAIRKNDTHILVQGTLTWEKSNKIHRIYLPTETVIVGMANVSPVPDNSQFRALENSILITISHAALIQILTEIPNFRSLATKILEKEKKLDREWEKITQMHFSEAIPRIKEKMGRQFHLLSRKKLAEMMEVCPKTIFRYNKTIYESRKAVLVRAQATGIFNYPFSSALHLEVGEIDQCLSKWIADRRLLASQKATHIFQKKKIAWLTARLYPESNLEKSSLLAKLHAFFWILDNYCNQIPRGQKSIFGKEIEGLLKQVMDGNIGNGNEKLPGMKPFLTTFAGIWTELKHYSSPGCLSILRDNFSSHLREECWLATAEDADRPISASSYMEKRSVLSCAYLALNLIPFALEDKYSEVVSVWPCLKHLLKPAATMIFTSLDLVTHSQEQFEKNSQDWIGLLIKNESWSEEVATNYLLGAHKNAWRTFMETEKYLLADSHTKIACQRAAITAMKYQIAGALAWATLDAN